ncbi:MAG: DUF3365 domain-containing protein [Coriobacteriales bacterium]|nr:DUF3365 domain-containing protein [Coriobacteriales bacterium]
MGSIGSIRDVASRLSKLSLKTKIIGLLALLFVVLFCVDIVWTYRTQLENTKEELLEESRVLVQEMNAVWDFVSLNQDVINYTSQGTYDYKGIHCAIAGKAVAALFSRNSEYTMRFVNSNPRNIYNTPDPYESEALQTFYAAPERADEFYGFSDLEGEQVFRYVSVMRMSADCAECHGEPLGTIDPTGYAREGWREGDIAGAVSVVVPTELYYRNLREDTRNSIVFFLTVLIGLMGISYFAITRLISRPLNTLQSNIKLLGEGAPLAPQKRNVLYASREVEGLFDQFNEMADRLEALYEGLESQVAERTEQLRAANAELDLQRQRVEQANVLLKQENRYKSDFLAIVSHELRTPLTSILAFTELLDEAIAPGPSDARRRLEEIERNGQTLLEMIENVLQTARIQAGSDELNLELVDLNDLVGFVEETAASLALKQGVALSSRIDPRVPLITSDWEKLRRILVNLVSNAIKFTEAGGQVSIEVFCVEEGAEGAGGAGAEGAEGAGAAAGAEGVEGASVETDPGLTSAPPPLAATICIQVKDNGIGIARDRQDMIFERFTQENMSTVRRYGGSGLGLSLVKDLCAVLGGSVSVQSEPGKGSTFSVILPVCGPKTGGSDENHAD